MMKGENRENKLESSRSCGTSLLIAMIDIGIKDKNAKHFYFIQKNNLSLTEKELGVSIFRKFRNTCLFSYIAFWIMCCTVL